VTRRALAPAALALAALAACTSSSSRPGARFRSPSAVAVYRGYSLDRPSELRPYVAVANARGDDLRIVDGITDRPVLAPALILALSVPVTPRPARLAAGPLHDRDPVSGDPVELPDLLAVASTGLQPRAGGGLLGAVLQVVSTWDPQTRVAQELDLGAVAPGAEVLSLAVGPVPEDDGAGGWRPAPGRARIYAGLTGGLLAVAEAAREAGGGSILVSAPVVEALGFEVVSLAVSPRVAHLYAATTDPIPGPGGVLGVAELDVTGPAGGGVAVRALAARGGTTHVVALEYGEFEDFGVVALDPDRFGAPVLAVLAALSPEDCGRDRAVACGVVTIDPVAGRLRPDPRGEQGFMAPIPVPGQVVAMAATGPSAVPPVVAAPVGSTWTGGYLRLSAGSGQRYTTGLVAIASTVGRVYLHDPAHFALANATSLLAASSTGSTNRTRVTNIATLLPTTRSGGPQPAGTQHLALWDDRPASPDPSQDPPPDPSDPVLLDDVSMASIVTVTPGYTPSDSWSLTWQGILPALDRRVGVVASAGAGIDWIAVQDPVGPTVTAPWRNVARLYDPRLAIRVGDIVEVTPVDTALCPSGTFEAAVTALLPPAADHPGGAVAVSPLPRTNLVDGVEVPADPTCLDGRGATRVVVTVHAAGLVLTGTETGYAGRPDIVGAADNRLGAIAPRFTFGYRDEAGPFAGLGDEELGCPILVERNEDWPPSAGAVAACEADAAACRAACERKLLSRKARRLMYVTDKCDELLPKSQCSDFWTAYQGDFPSPVGPAIAFKVGLKLPPGDATAPEDAIPGTVRGATLAIATASGILPEFRTPYSGVSVSGAELPSGVAVLDRAAATGDPADGLHVYVAYPDGVVLDFDTNESASNATSIR
jgi:hypothetical protein